MCALRTVHVTSEPWLSCIIWSLWDSIHLNTDQVLFSKRILHRLTVESTMDRKVFFFLNIHFIFRFLLINLRPFFERFQVFSLQKWKSRDDSLLFRFHSRWSNLKMFDKMKVIRQKLIKMSSQSVWMQLNTTGISQMNSLNKRYPFISLGRGHYYIHLFFNSQNSLKWYPSELLVLWHLNVIKFAAFLSSRTKHMAGQLVSIHLNFPNPFVHT